LKPLTVATWNVNGFRARQSQLVEWGARDRPDVIALQELKATPEQLGETLFLLPEYWNFWHGGPKGYSGVSLHVRKDALPGRPEFTHPPFDTEFRAVQARLDGGLVVASLYVPNGGKDYGAKLRFLEALLAFVESARAAGTPLVLCGDMNVSRADIDLTPKERKRGAIGQRADERALFERILSAGMVDVARALHPDQEGMFTWWPPWREMRQKNEGWRIDYVLALGFDALECTVLADVGTSDHAPVVARLQPRSPG
jgi:exodeoxyribonuclease-3